MADFRRGVPIGSIQFHGRWEASRSMNHYLQSGLAEYAASRFPTKSAQLIMTLQRFPMLQLLPNTFVPLLRFQNPYAVKHVEDDNNEHGDASAEVFEEVQDHSDLAARIHASFNASRADVGGWMKLSDSAYINQRNRVLGV